MIYNRIVKQVFEKHNYRLSIIYVFLLTSCFRVAENNRWPPFSVLDTVIFPPAYFQYDKRQIDTAIDLFGDIRERSMSYLTKVYHISDCEAVIEIMIGSPDVYIAVLCSDKSVCWIIQDQSTSRVGYIDNQEALRTLLRDTVFAFEHYNSGISRISTRFSMILISYFKANKWNTKYYDYWPPEIKNPVLLNFEKQGLMPEYWNKLRELRSILDEFFQLN